ncbi:MAG: arsenate reductase ArsC [Pseudomonadota bacterium]
MEQKNVLILCTGNSARSIIGEALINHLGSGRYRGYSAGSKPTGTPNPFALRLLEEKGYDTGFARSKTWSEFEGPNAPEMHFVFTVCDSAANEACPIWPGTPMRAHWGIPDPAAATGSDDIIMKAFEKAHSQMHERVSAFMALSPDEMDPSDLMSKITEIGKMGG